jgi:anaerobic selenocysteine-containing dehydrogenase
MNRWAWGAAAILLLGVLVTAVVFAVWASAGDAPWENEATCADCASPCPSPSQEEAEKIACLQGGGEWLHIDVGDPGHGDLCDPAPTAGSREPCWACLHRR